jgi:hypothetical protein
MIKKINSNILKIDPDGNCYLEDQDNKRYYEACWSDYAAGETKVKIRIDKFYMSIILFVISGIGLAIYLLFIK